MRRWRFFIAIVISLEAHMCLADPGETGAAFLKLGVGARGLAMGEAYSAAAQGVEGLYWNPANISQTENFDFFLGYNPLIEKTNYGQAAFSMRAKTVGLAFGYNAVSYGSLDTMDEVGNKTGNFQAADRMALGGISFPVKKLRVGMTARFIESEIDNVKSSGFSTDFGAQFYNPFGWPMQHALVVKNFIASGLTFNNDEAVLPTTTIFGNAIRLARPILLTLDVSSVKQSGAVLAGGLEWSPLPSNPKLFSLRGGYTNRRNEAEGLSGASFGAGFIFKDFSLDYAWLPFGELGDSHVISLIWHMPKWKGNDTDVTDHHRYKNTAPSSSKRSSQAQPSSPTPLEKNSLGNLK